MMILDGPWQGWEPPPGSATVTVGVLDGVHLGHRALLAEMSPSLSRTVLTFEPHPVEVLRPGTPPRLITTLDERVGLLDGLGIEVVGVLDLRVIKELEPEEFVTGILVDRLSVSQLVTGVDFRFGKDRGGDVDLLARLGDRLGFAVIPVPIVSTGADPISSSRIRSLIEEGRVAEANRLLGSRFAVANTVVGGDKRGREIGFPTANLRPPPRKLIPSHGVYACFAGLGEVRHPAAVNVGVRPTFGGGDVLIEAYLLDFEGDLYDQEIRVEFVEYLRPELAFDSVDALIEQMAEDVSATRSILDAAGDRM